MTNQELYKNQLRSAMSWLAEKDDTLFLGQSVKYPGTGMFDTLDHINHNKKLEFPVAENFQMGFSIGMSLNGIVPISVFPRWNFLLCATDQLVNHLDKLNKMSDGGYLPKVIIRVAVGSETPIDPQDQHKGNFSTAFAKMLDYVNIIELTEPSMILPMYKFAYEGSGSTIMVEFPDYGK